MKNVLITRIDDRLIHGQVVTAWIKVYPINKILIIDDLIISEGTNFKSVRNLIDIKKIKDYGDYYQIYFKWPKKHINFYVKKTYL